jgi:hypothetical protein
MSNRIIRMLEEMKVKEEENFITNSLIKRASLIDSPVPDVDKYLERIVELNEAISVLNNHSMQKPCKNN